MKQEVDRLKTEVLVHESRSKRLIISGPTDVNARVGCIQDVEEKEEVISINGNITSAKQSTDETVNARGRKIEGMVDECEIILLNGRVKGDLNGELTFFGGIGESVIDLAGVSFNLIIVMSMK